jgi:hypothetical protein
MASYFSLHAQRKVTKRKGIPGARASHALSHLHCQRVVLTRIPARQDSIDPPWSIDPTSEAGFGELDGRNSFPLKFAEAFGFGRENSTGTSNLVLSSPDGESGRPVGKGECLGDPKGKLVGRRSFGYFSSAVGRKVTRHQGETKCY